MADRVNWQRGKPKESGFCFADFGDEIKMVWFGTGFKNGTWFELCEDCPYMFQDFLKPEDIKRWIMVNDCIAPLLQQTDKLE